jgi:hypothetical protein
VGRENLATERHEKDERRRNSATDDTDMGEGYEVKRFVH